MQPAFDDPSSVVTRYLNAITTFNVPDAMEFWDVCSSDVSLVPEEIANVIQGHEAIADYWKAAARSFTDFVTKPGLLQSRLLTPEITLVLFPLEWAMKPRVALGGAPPVGGSVFVSVVLRKHASHWRIVHWAETVLGALPFIRRAYQRAGLEISNAA